MAKAWARRVAADTKRRVEADSCVLSVDSLRTLHISPASSGRSIATHTSDDGSCEFAVFQALDVFIFKLVSTTARHSRVTLHSLSRMHICTISP